MKTYKEENGLDHLFFSITDTKNKEANLRWVDESDYQVIKSAFNAEPTSDMLSLSASVRLALRYKKQLRACRE
ncbi:putative exopolyphosphatase [Vibrio coralliirubri]|nr:putative exopolyphosphatase [Vibrio coralliirubri]CDT72890.1 putative exopolyphosphatase [Vibrio coralliirubri]